MHYDDHQPHRSSGHPLVQTAAPTILVADVNDGLVTFSNVLEQGVRLIQCQTIKEVMSIDPDNLDMIVCGIHFDDSRMFDFLRLAKGNPKLRSKPFLCFRDLESELASTFLESLEISCRALGVVSFVDLFSLRKQFGLPRADDVFRGLVLYHLRLCLEASKLRS